MRAERELSDFAKPLALKLFDDCSNYISTKILFRAQRRYFHNADFDKFSPFGGLHCACIFGIYEIVVGLVEAEGCDINKDIA